MKWLSPYEHELHLAFTEAEAILATFPESFRKPALDYLDKFHVLKENRSKNYICYLLPFWLQEHAGLASGDVRRFAVANIFGMMYYHLIDACMDEPEAVMAQQLPLAEFIHLEFVQIYSGYFPGGSPFWTYFKKYVSQWAEAVSGEKTSDFYHDDPVRMGHKAAPVKLTVAGSMLLVNREADIPRLEEAVDNVLVTLQLLDDWQDWEKDLNEGSYNALVSIVQSELKIPRERRPAPEEIRQAITVQSVLANLAEHAERNHESLVKYRTLVPGLYQFHESLRDNLKEGAIEIENERNLLQRGGLGYWLSKNM
ncbi:hypothetical protein DFP94_103286 [Fontibacillus phaseoli]|uniref:Heptaprenyl diphosphate synthase n=1 Tax=Fontibacillus phaseoli TaxID=1416533 RepID=A0A369BH17_9BACL|nr:hypothetical protein [Fontibacillus phaseoli]RCX20555.1 hypothetical protein DFP94_103286 [Fontibacillus phaseoli]